MYTILFLNKAERMMTLPNAGQEQKNYITGTLSLNIPVNSLQFVKGRTEEPTFVWCREANGKLITQLNFILVLL